MAVNNPQSADRPYKFFYKLLGTSFINISTIMGIRLNSSKQKLQEPDNADIFIKKKDGRKILNNLIYKVITNEELSDTEAIDLIVLPDMNIDIPIKQLIKVITFLIANCNIPNDDFKKKIILCEIKVLSRFFKNDELEEMIDLLKTLTKNPEVERIIEKYGEGFDSIYFDGKADGFNDGKLQVARNLLIDGFDEDVVSRNTGISINKIKNLKREL